MKNWTFRKRWQHLSVSSSESVSCMPALEGLPPETVLTQPLLAMQYLVHIFLQGFLGRVRT